MASCLEKAGFARVSQRGSHVKLRNQAGRTVIVPHHRELAGDETASFGGVDWVAVAAVTVNTPSGKRRQATRGTVEHAANMMPTRSSSSLPGREGAIPPCESSAANPPDG